MARRLGKNLAAGTFLLGLSLAGPQVGLAAADAGDTASAGTAVAAERAAAPARASTTLANRPTRHAAARPAAAAPAAAVANRPLKSLDRSSIKTAAPRPVRFAPRPFAASAAGTIAPASAVTAAPAVTPVRCRICRVNHVLDNLSALASGLPGGPLSDSVSGALELARRSLMGPNAAAANATGAAVTALNPKQHVLLIGVDGTDLSKILEDPANTGFFNLMEDGTTAASTMAGHTTISAPGWTGILTGVWSEIAGVSNNVFTPWTYDKWPTVFNQLESADPNIATTVIANWEVIAQIAGAGSKPADTIVFYPEINKSWEETDDAVGNKSIQAIQNTVPGKPSLQMTYFVGVDNSGHDTYGAGSPEYAAALRNVSENITSIMTAVDAWETANPGETWTVISVTDHGQVLKAPLSPIVSGLLAHGFQSPIETSPWIIADGPDFRDGYINNTYSQVDVTPTILKLFGLGTQPYFQGKPMMDRAAQDYKPALPGLTPLKSALKDALAMYGYPDPSTTQKLSFRTIVATGPYLVYTVATTLAAKLPSLLSMPVLFLGAVAYQIVNIPAQFMVRLTGVTGNQLIPPKWWPYNPVPGVQPVPATAVPVPVTV